MTQTGVHEDARCRHDFVLIFDVTDGNPNGDPDAGNLPRVDPETMHGLVTDVCLKRKVRNYVQVLKDGEEGYGIYVNDAGVALNALHERAYTAEGIKSTGTKQKREDVDAVRKRMCATYFDVRMFGAVMTTGVNCGQVRGPVQMTFSRSIDPIVPMDVSITRVAVTRVEDADVVVSDDGHTKSSGKTTEMGRKALVPYGLYVGYGFYCAPFAEKTGVSSDDLALFWQALRSMWDIDRSSSRGLMACRGLYVFSHADRLGSAPAQDLFNLVDVRRNSEASSPRSFADYAVRVGEEELPNGVTLTRLVG
ncbi:MAG: type I-C CRISPR-associated protein Cas7/Csd2 [Coriobacteriia bacterium]